MADMPGYRRVNYYELCRLCTSSEGAKMHLFREEGRRRSLTNKIQKCLPLKVHENDSLPKIICNVCAEKLEVFYEFRESCVNAEAMLESYFTSLKCSDDTSREVSVYIKDTKESPFRFITTKTKWKSVETSSSKTDPIQLIAENEGDTVGSYKVDVAYPSGIQQPVKVVQETASGTQTTETAEPITPTLVATVITPQATPELFSFETKDKYQAPLAQVSEFLKMKNISILDTSVTTNATESGDNLPGLRIHSDQLGQIMVASGIKTVVKNNDNEHGKKGITGNRPFGCGFCGKAFSRKEHLIRHKVSHTGKREYDCEVCQKTFSRKDNLLKHKKTHGIIGPYVCAVCGKSFVIKHYYLVHRETHDKTELEEKEAAIPSPPPLMQETNVKCHICAKEFLSKSALATHVRIRHPRKRPSRKKKKAEIMLPLRESQPSQIQAQTHQQTILASFPITAGLATINPHALLTPGLVSAGNMVQIGNASYVCTELVDHSYQTLQS